MLTCTQGNCTTVPTLGSLGYDESSLLPLRTLKSGQCVMLSMHALFSVSGIPMWLDSVYLRMLPSPGSYLPPILSTSDTSLWMTNVSLQGDGDGVKDCPVCGFIASDQSDVFAKGAIYHYCFSLPLCLRQFGVPEVWPTSSMSLFLVLVFSVHVCRQ